MDGISSRPEWLPLDYDFNEHRARDTTDGLTHLLFSFLLCHHRRRKIYLRASLRADEIEAGHTAGKGLLQHDSVLHRYLGKMRMENVMFTPACCCEVGLPFRRKKNHTSKLAQYSCGLLPPVVDRLCSTARLEGKTVWTEHTVKCSTHSCCHLVLLYHHDPY